MTIFKIWFTHDVFPLPGLSWHLENRITLKLPKVIYMELLPIMFIHYPAKRYRENSNLSGKSCYLDLTLKSHNRFTRKCIATGGENVLGAKGLRW